MICFWKPETELEMDLLEFWRSEVIRGYWRSLKVVGGQHTFHNSWICWCVLVMTYVLYLTCTSFEVHEVHMPICTSFWGTFSIYQKKLLEESAQTLDEIIFSLNNAYAHSFGVGPVRWCGNLFRVHFHIITIWNKWVAYNPPPVYVIPCTPKSTELLARELLWMFILY